MATTRSLPTPRRTGTTAPPSTTAALTGENVGDQLNTKDLSWGWFQGGFAPTTPYSGPVSTATTYDPLNNPDKVTVHVEAQCRCRCGRDRDDRCPPLWDRQ